MHDFFENLIPLMIVGMIGAVIIAPLYWRAKERRQALDIVRTAVERDGPVPVELMNAMGAAFRSRPEISPTHDLRRGLFLLAIGAAIMVAALGLHIGIRSIPENESFTVSVVVGLAVGSLGMIPLFVGIAYVLLGLGGKRPQA